MPSTYTTNLGIEKIGTGEQSGTWGTTTNTNFDLIDQGVNGIVQVTLAAVGSTGSPNALTIDNGALSDGRNKFIEFVDGGDLGGTAYVQLQPNDSEKVAFIRNSLSGSRSIIIFQGTYNASNDFEIPNGADVVLKFDGAGASATVTQVFENLTVSSATLASGVTVNAILDEDNMASDSDTALATQQSIKAYVDSQVTAQDLDIAGDTGTGAVDLDSQSLTIAGTANEIETSASGQTITVGLPNAVTIADLTATTADINGGTIDGTVIGGSSAAAGSFTTITASGEITANGGIALGDNQKATFGASDDLQIYHDGSNSIINDNGVGSLILRATNFRLFNADQTKVSILANDGSNTSLYYDGSPKLATTATGIDVTGTVTADGLTVDGKINYTSAVNGILNAPASMFINIDSDNNNTGEVFRVTKDTDSTSGTKLFEVKENGDISFYEDTGTTAKFFWDASAESLGIGTTSPGSLLEVAGVSPIVEINSTSGSPELQFSDGGVDEFSIQYDTGANALKFVEGGVGTHVTILDGGNVGIGITNPFYKLVVSAGGASGIEFGPAYSGTANLVQHYSRSGGVYVDAVNEAAQHRFNISGSEKARIDSSGNVGIGTTSPAFYQGSGLEIERAGIATVRLQNTTTGKSAELKIDTDVTLETINTGSSLLFNTAATERMRIDSSGNLLVGVTAPVTLPDNSVGGGVSMSTDGQLIAGRNNAAPASFKRTTSNGDVVTFHKDGSTVGSISVTSSTTTYNITSDQRLKDNIVDAPAGNVDDIKVRSFDWKADGSHQEYGMVAQELEAVAPYAVTKGETEDDMWSVDYSKLVPMLIKEIQDLKAEVAALKGA